MKADMLYCCRREVGKGKGRKIRTLIRIWALIFFSQRQWETLATWFNLVSVSRSNIFQSVFKLYEQLEMERFSALLTEASEISYTEIISERYITLSCSGCQEETLYGNCLIDIKGDECSWRSFLSFLIQMVTLQLFYKHKMYSWINIWQIHMTSQVFL